MAKDWYTPRIKSPEKNKKASKASITIVLANKVLEQVSLSILGTNYWKIGNIF